MLSFFKKLFSAKTEEAAVPYKVEAPVAKTAPVKKPAVKKAPAKTTRKPKAPKA